MLPLVMVAAMLSGQDKSTMTITFSQTGEVTAEEYIHTAYSLLDACYNNGLGGNTACTIANENDDAFVDQL